MEEEMREALRRSVLVLDDVLKQYGVPWRAAQKLQDLRNHHASVLARVEE